MRSGRFFSRCGRVAWVMLLATFAFSVPAAAQGDGTINLIPLKTLPESSILNGVPNYAQRWGLSCEYAATSAATAFYGKQISEATFLEDIGYDVNPHKGFRGRINGGWGGINDYGIYAAPILKVLKQRGFEHSFSFYNDPTLLKYEIAAGHPVVVWIVGTWGTAPRYEEQQGGESYILVPYEHAITAYGYDDTGLYVMDVGSGGKYKVNWATFMRSWKVLDGMALSVSP